MIPDVPPALQPKDSRPRHKVLLFASPRRFQYWLVIVPLLVVTISTALLMTRSQSKQPSSDIAAAMQNFSQSPNIQLSGEVKVNQTGLMRGDSVAFTAVKQPGSLHTDGFIPGQIAGAPLQSVITATGEHYINLGSTAYLDDLVENANPVAALQLLRIEAVVNTHAKDRWLQLSTEDRALLNKRQKPDGVLMPLLRQSCLAYLLAAPTSENQPLIEGIRGMLAGQTAQNQGSETVNGMATTKYRLYIHGERLAEARVRDDACADGRQDAALPDTEVTLWIDNKAKQLTHLQHVLHESARTVVITTDVAYEKLPARTVPKDAVPLNELQERAKTDDPKVEELVNRRLKAFPHLDAIVRVLREDEAQRSL